MKLKLRISPRQTRILYTLAAIIALAICMLNFYLQMFLNITGNDQCRWVDKAGSRLLITDLVKNGVTEQAGIRDGDFLLKINGQSFASGTAAQFIINRNAGTYVTYTIERGGIQSDHKVFILRSFSLLYFAQFIYGLGFLLVGYLVVMVRPQGKLQRMFGRFSIYSMLFFGLAAFNFDPVTTPLWQQRLLLGTFLVNTVFALPVFVRFFMFFPAKHRSFENKTLTVILYSISFLFAAIIGFGNTRLTPAVIITVAFARYGFYVTGLTYFIVSYFKLVEPARRGELRPMLFGVAIGILAFFYAFGVQAINPFAAFLNPTILFPFMLLVVVPVFFGYAIFRYGLMDVDLVIRRSLVYGAVTATLAAVYFGLIYGVGSILSWYFTSRENTYFQIGSLVLIALAFDPLKQRFQNGIDRMFFRERYDYQKAMLEFTQELPRLMELDHISQSLMSRISTTMHIEQVAVVICGDHEGCATVAKNIQAEDCVFSEKDRSLMQLLRKTGKPADLRMIGQEADAVELNEEEREKIARSGVVLSVPMFLKDRLVGFINVGSKMSGKVYAQEDIDLLSTVAGQAAIGIENARLHKTEIEQQRNKEELEVARNIQQGLFPRKNPAIPGLDIAGVSLPALSVGGDYYDYIQLSPTKLLTVVADVAGKGMSAALYMSKIQGMVQLAAHMYKTPKDMLVNINRRIFEGMDRKSFITMILALIDTKKKEVVICRAGHNKAIVGTNGKMKILDGHGIGLGLERGPKFERAIEEVSIPLKPDSLFLLYTDGISEAMNEENKEFGEERILHLLQRNSKKSAAIIKDQLLQAIEKHRGSAEQHDDITMIVIKRQSPISVP